MVALQRGGYGVGQEQPRKPGVGAARKNIISSWLDLARLAEETAGDDWIFSRREHAKRRRCGPGQGACPPPSVVHGARA
jgi:hypothetical protein